MRDFSVPNDACLQIRNHSINFIEAQVARGGLQIVRLGAQGPPGTGADGVSALVERGHSSAWTPATDRPCEARAIETGRSPNGPNREITVSRIAVGEGAVAIGAA